MYFVSSSTDGAAFEIENRECAHSRFSRSESSQSPERGRRHTLPHFREHDRVLTLSEFTRPRPGRATRGAHSHLLSSSICTYSSLPLWRRVWIFLSSKPASDCSQTCSTQVHASWRLRSSVRDSPSSSKFKHPSSSSPPPPRHMLHSYFQFKYTSLFSAIRAASRQGARASP